MSDITEILHSASDGDEEARAQLVQAAYEDLRRLAGARMAGARPDHTLTATALVNELAMRLLAESQLPKGGRGEFMAYAAKAMRNLLIDHARHRGRQKRGGDLQKFSFEEAMIASQEQSEDLLALNEALQLLAESEPRKAQVVEMRYFGGLSNQETADALGISLATVKRDWDVARALLLRALKDQSAAE